MSLNAELTPSRYPSSVEVTADTATLLEPLETRAREAVRSASSIVVAAPVIVACFVSNCV